MSGEIPYFFSALLIPKTNIIRAGGEKRTIGMKNNLHNRIVMRLPHGGFTVIFHIPKMDSSI
jgi:hypothetical protein